jgi:hypothetical protein
VCTNVLMFMLHILQWSVCCLNRKLNCVTCDLILI